MSRAVQRRAGRRHADHGRILAALPTNDQDTARFEMEKRIVGTVEFAPNANR
jgi:hypothetical protein